MAFFKAKVGDTIYEIDKLSLGDTRILKRRFGLTDLAEFSSTDPDVIVGLLALAIHKTEGKTLDAATLEAEALDFESFSPAEDDEAPEADAVPLADASVETVEPVVSGNPETTQPTPGDPSTPTS